MKAPSSEQMIKTTTNSKNLSSHLPLSPFLSISLFSPFSSSLRFSDFSIFSLNSPSPHRLAPFPLKNSLPLSFSLFFIFILGSFSPTFSTSHVLRLKTWEGGLMWVCECVGDSLSPTFLAFFYLLFFNFFCFFLYFCIFFILYIYIYIF